MNDLMGPKEVADYVGLARGSVYVYKSNGKMPPVDAMISGRGYWTQETIEAWATENRVGRFRRAAPR